jgi:hypothetical protein
LVEIWLSSFRGEYFLNFIPLFSIFSLAAILVGSRDHRTTFVKEAIQESFQQSLVKLEKRGDETKKKSSPLKLLSQSQPNFAEMILGWPPLQMLSGDPDFQPRWPPS